MRCNRWQTIGQTGRLRPQQTRRVGICRCGTKDQLPACNARRVPVAEIGQALDIDRFTFKARLILVSSNMKATGYSGNNLVHGPGSPKPDRLTVSIEELDPAAERGDLAGHDPVARRIGSIVPADARLVPGKPYPARTCATACCNPDPQPLQFTLCQNMICLMAATKTPLGAARWQSYAAEARYLSPDVLQRLVTQRVPLALSLNELIAVAELPWAEQMAHVLSGSNSQIG